MAYRPPVMASRKDRFGALGGSGDDAVPGQTADLFEHYGIALEPAGCGNASAAIDALPCRRCGWFLALARDTPGCPLCAEPEPLAPPVKRG